MKAGAFGKAGRGALVGAAAALIALVFWGSGALDAWERVNWDWRVRLMAQPGASSDSLRVILLDQASLDWGQEVNGWSWPWPREVYAPLIDFCRRGGARAIAFDVLFTEPSIYGVYDDQALALAMAAREDFVGALFLGSSEAGVATRPIPELADAATALGNVNDRPDPDGIFRRGTLARHSGEGILPSLATAAWLVTHPDAEIEIGSDQLRLGDRTIPLNEENGALLRYPGPDGLHRSYGAAAVIQSELRLREGLEGSVDPVDFAGRYVLFGFSAPGLLDERATPMSRVAPGVEIHATVLENIMDRSFLRDAGKPAVILSTLILAILAGLLMTLSRRVASSVVLFIVLLPLPLLAGLLAYRLGLWWPVMVGEASVALALTGGILLNYATEGRQKRFIKQAFKFYLSPAVIERLLADPDKLALGGERKELSILFCDLAGFTALSESLEPEALTTLLNAYLTDMTNIVLAEGGTLDKYEGDAFIAFWNAPISQPDHARRACRAALTCRRKLDERRAAYRELGGSDLFMRVGIHTGAVVVGNMGSSQRFDYTVLGDAANLASRLEGANKAFGTSLMISEATRRAAGEALLYRELAMLRVVGRREPVTVHELVGLAGEEKPAGLSTFTEALDALRKGRTEEALTLLRDLPEDPAAEAYLEYMMTVDADWDGTWNLTSK